MKHAALEFQRFWLANCNNAADRIAIAASGMTVANLFQPSKIDSSDYAKVQTLHFALLTAVGKSLVGCPQIDVHTAVTKALLGAYGLGQRRGAGKIDKVTGETLPSQRALDALMSADLAYRRAATAAAEKTTTEITGDGA